MNKEGKRIINAIALGDGHVGVNKNIYSITVNHSEAQKEYIQYKAKLLEDIFDSPVNVYKYMNGKYPGYRFYKSNRYLKFLRRWLYPQNKKQISLSFLKTLDDKGVAIWYMDDGSLIAKKRNGIIHAYDLVISTYCSEEEAIICISFFKERYNVDFTIKRNKGWCSIRCGTKNARKFLSKIDLHIIPSMRYKSIDTMQKINFSYSNI